jgi:Arc/MetJ-type ribon-helix-helix transcriptional regulator
MLDRRMQLVVDDRFVEMIDEWRRRQPEIVSRSEAVRALVLKAIQNERPTKAP